MSSKSRNPQQKRYYGSGNREKNPEIRIIGGDKISHIITNCWKLHVGGKTPCEYCGKFNHKYEDCKIAKHKLQKS